MKARCLPPPQSSCPQKPSASFSPRFLQSHSTALCPGSPAVPGEGLFAFPFAFFSPLCFSGRGGTCGLGGWSDGTWILVAEGYWRVHPCGPQLPCLQGPHPVGAGAALGAVCFSHRGLQGRCSLLIPWHKAKLPPCSLPWGLRGAAKLRM